MIENSNKNEDHDKKIKISVIMPIYNDETFIGESLKSIINQTLKDIEIICINDGSTDNSLTILKNYQKNYPNIIIINQKNQGSGIARNEGLKIAKGEYIAFLDADDYYINTNALECMFETGIEKNSIMVTANLKNVKDKKLVDNYYCKKIENLGIILPEDYGMPWYFYRSIYKKKFLKDNNIIFPNYLRGQDPIFLAKVLSKIEAIDTVPIDFYAYRYIPIKNNTTKCNTKQKKIDYISHYIDVFSILSNPKFYNMITEYENNLKKFLKKEIKEENEIRYILEACDNNIFLFKFFENNIKLNKKEKNNVKLKKTIKNLKSSKSFKLKKSMKSILNRFK
jgi:glycosyltransferase involved in cell wall biosynthesis